jgi:hypothetical protein
MPTKTKTKAQKSAIAVALQAEAEAKVEAPTPTAPVIQAPVEREVLNPEFVLEPFRVTSLTLDLDNAETVPVYGEYLHSPTGSILELEPESAASDAMQLIEDETGFSVKSIELATYTYA